MKIIEKTNFFNGLFLKKKAKKDLETAGKATNKKQEKWAFLVGFSCASWLILRTKTNQK
jgi:hypothetical protein